MHSPWSLPDLRGRCMRSAVDHGSSVYTYALLALHSKIMHNVNPEHVPDLPTPAATLEGQAQREDGDEITTLLMGIPGDSIPFKRGANSERPSDLLQVTQLVPWENPPIQPSGWCELKPCS